MLFSAGFVEKYLLQWNDPSKERRHEIVCNLWRPEAFTCHRLGIWRGHREIQARVDSAQKEWVSSDNYRFVASEADVVACHNVVRLIWRMVRSDDEAIISIGCNYLLMHADGRIEAEYQFLLPTAPVSQDVTDLVAGYFDVWNSSDAAIREARIKNLWTDEGAHVGPTYDVRGHGALVREAERLFREYGGKGQFFECAGNLGAHNEVVRFDWMVRGRAGHASELRGSSFLMLDSQGRVTTDFQFPATPAGE